MARASAIRSGPLLTRDRVVFVAAPIGFGARWCVQCCAADDGVGGRDLLLHAK